MLDIVNYGMIEHPTQSIRIIIGNIEGTNNIYMKRESLQIERETSRKGKTREEKTKLRIKSVVCGYYM